MAQALQTTGLQIYQFAGLKPGPKLLILGAVHGNETCGTEAINRVRQEIESGQIQIERGTVTLLPITNPLAYQLKRRHGDRNLNRSMSITLTPQDYEDEISNQLCPLLNAHEVLLDLHSFHTPGIPFALIGPRNNCDDLEPFNHAEEEEQMALNLGVTRFVEGWLETYAQGVRDRQARGVEAQINYGIGTTETIRRYGGMGVTLECGQHEDKEAPQVAYRAIMRTLSHLNLTSHEIDPAPKNVNAEIIQLYQVVDRLNSDDRFSQDWQSFEEIRQGEVLAYRADGSEIKADQDGWIIFPNPSAQVDQEWFYLAKKSDRFKQ